MESVAGCCTILFGADKQLQMPSFGTGGGGQGLGRAGEGETADRFGPEQCCARFTLARVYSCCVVPFRALCRYVFTCLFCAFTRCLKFADFSNGLAYGFACVLRRSHTIEGELDVRARTQTAGVCLTGICTYGV